MSECRIEQALYQTLQPGAHPIKVAMLIVKAFGAEGFPADVEITDALIQLSKLSDVEFFGDTQKWRQSEVRRKAD